MPTVYKFDSELLSFHYETDYHQIWPISLMFTCADADGAILYDDKKFPRGVVLYTVCDSFFDLRIYHE